MTRAIGAAELAARLGGAVRVLDCRTRPEYDAGHVPGAVHVGVGAWPYFGTSPEQLTAFAAHLDAVFSAAGVRPDLPTVCYETGAGYYAAFAAWALRYAGAADAALLDGGFTAWLRAGLPVGPGPGRGGGGAAPTAFTTTPDAGVLVTADELHGLLGASDLRVVDVRSHKERRGVVRRAPRAGWIPGAVHLPWTEGLTTVELAPADALTALFGRLGVTPEHEVVTYCHAGWRAAHTDLVLRRCGFPRVRTYLGSWSEWAGRTDLPVEIDP